MFRLLVIAAVFVKLVIAAEFVDVVDVFPTIAPHKRSADIFEHPPSLVVNINKHRLNLELNGHLIPPHFVSHYEDENGEHRYEQGHPNCFYHGSVEGHPDWHVALSTCQGFRGVYGDPGRREDYYYIEPSANGNAAISDRHKLYIGYSEANASCGACSKTKSLPPVDSFVSASSSFSHGRVRRQAVVRTVEWTMVNDHSQYVAFGRNLTAVVLRDLEIANVVDRFFRQLNIRVAVVSTITWTRGNKMEFPPDNNLDTTLSRFSEYVATITTEQDSTMLITNEDLPGNTLGYAYVGGICRGQASVGMTEDGNKRFFGTITTITAHELGHILSMEHDTSSCTCTDSSGRCIMAAITTTPPATSWSSCSVNVVNNAIRRNLGTCLLNSPSQTVGDPICGNGIREGKEVCDCGSVEECTDKCCNPRTCQLVAGAQCSMGQCCSEQCQFLPRGSVCRNASNECDIAEYCQGDSSRCPRDVYKQDTTSCLNQEAVCYEGQCRTRDNQCQLYFGSRNALDECYSRLNVGGIASGNCGSSGTSYLPCGAEDVTCGQLHCELGILNQDLVGRSYTPVNVRLPVGSCHSFTHPATADTLSLGLVDDGTKCGNNSVCQGQKCTSISALTHIKPCPVGANNQTCSGEGICNNLNECSCNVGLYGDACDRTSPGGGKLSGGAIASIFFGLLFGIALAGGVIALILFVLYKRKNKPYSVRTSRTTSNNYSTKPSTSRPPPKPATSNLPPRATPKPVPSKPLPVSKPSSKPPPRAIPSKPPPPRAIPSKPPPPRATPSKPPPPRATPSKPPPKPVPPAKAPSNGGQTKPLPHWPPPSSTSQSSSQPLHAVKAPAKKPPSRPPPPQC